MNEQTKEKAIGLLVPTTFERIGETITVSVASPLGCTILGDESSNFPAIKHRRAA